MAVAVALTRAPAKKIMCACRLFHQLRPSVHSSATLAATCKAKLCVCRLANSVVVRRQSSGQECAHAVPLKRFTVWCLCTCRSV
jgi:hypothetical protein